MPEQPTTQFPESDLARGLAEFRQGRKSLLPEFELPTDDIPTEAQSEVCPERLTAYTFEQILKEQNVEERLKDPNFLKQLVEYFNFCFEESKSNPNFASYACWTLSAVRSLGIFLPGLNPEELNTKINNSKLLEQVTKDLNHNLKQAIKEPGYTPLVYQALSAVQSLVINLPELNSEELNAKINDPDFLKQLTDDLYNDLEQGKTNPGNASYACRTLSAARSLGIDLPGLNQKELIIKINNPNFLKQLTEYINLYLAFGKTEPSSASWICWTLASVQNLIKYYSAIADEKEKAQAAEKLQTAADRTGVPPRPEVKAF